MLTLRGAAGVRLLGAADRMDYVRRGLLPATGCPASGAVVAESSAKPRAIRTGEAYVDAMLPGCGISVAHPQNEGPEDAMFHAMDSATDFAGDRALNDARALAPPAGIGAEAAAHRRQISLLGRVLGCCAASYCQANNLPAGCDLTQLPTTLVGSPRGRPELTGPMAIGSTVGQTLLMEYLEGMPMREVGWGRVTRDDIEDLLVFHPIKFRYENGPASAARRSAGPLMRHMMEGLAQSGEGLRLMLLFGHDTNLADVGSLLQLTWQATGYPARDIPPGGALGFELLGDANGQQFVRAFFRAQTMDQLRNQEVLDPAARGYRTYLVIPGCAAANPTLCPLQRFQTLVQERLQGG
jgi:4-phytase/acid phosphatase